MFAEAQEEHRWLEPLIGEWTFESECYMGPVQPAMKAGGRVTSRSLGGLWILMETVGESPEGGKWTTQMTLGYDPARKKFVGAFVGSMMTELWVYSGQLDAPRRRIVLYTNGPKFDQSGTTQYKDTLELVDDDHWILSSQILMDDDTWLPFMKAHHRRID